MALIFQYGSNIFPDRINNNNRLMGDAVPLKLVCTKQKYNLIFPVKSKNNNCGAADIEPYGEKTIWGMLYRIPDYLLKRSTAGNRKSLDAIEGEGTNYKRVSIKLRYRNGKQINEDVITYIAKNRNKYYKTSKEYATYIIKGLRQSGAPKGYIEYAKKQISRNNPRLANDINNV